MPEAGAYEALPWVPRWRAMGVGSSPQVEGDSHGANHERLAAWRSRPARLPQSGRVNPWGFATPCSFRRPEGLHSSCGPAELISRVKRPADLWGVGDGGGLHGCSNPGHCRPRAEIKGESKGGKVAQSCSKFPRNSAETLK